MLSVAPGPHIAKRETTATIMWTVVISLIPALYAGYHFFGIRSLYIVAISIISAVLTEGICQRLLRKKVRIKDGSAVITGILLGFILPPSVPLWIPALGSFLAILLTKELFGGLGYNIFNPALVGRAILLAAYPAIMTAWVSPYSGITCATPLAILKEGLPGVIPTYQQLFIGARAGCIGEISALALLIGAAILFGRKIISYEIPLSFIAVVFLFSLFLGKDPLIQIMSGGLILGSFFMATDYVTTPITKGGKLIFGIGGGLLTSLIRFWGGYPEGVCYAILLMNGATPLIDHFTLRRNK